MQNLKDKTVFISGASSGIGEACAKAFAKLGAKLILCARRLEKLEDLAASLKSEFGTFSHIFQLDVRNREDVVHSIANIPESFKHIDVLVNNAGLSRGMDKLHEGLVSDWEEMIDTNVKGLLYLTKEIVPIMVENNAGHVINIGSTAGIHAYPGGNVYCATKAAVKFISDGLRQDVVDKPIRVTNIQPGMAETEFSIVRFHGDTNKANNVYKGIEPLTGSDIADIVVYTASAPAHVQICEVTVTPTNQATGGVLYKSE